MRRIAAAALAAGLAGCASPQVQAPFRVPATPPPPARIVEPGRPVTVLELPWRRNTDSPEKSLDCLTCP